MTPHPNKGFFCEIGTRFRVAWYSAVFLMKQQQKVNQLLLPLIWKRLILLPQRLLIHRLPPCVG
jgi:hypothetical protein